jgi:hypothetical protein
MPRLWVEMHKCNQMYSMTSIYVIQITLYLGAIRGALYYYQGTAFSWGGNGDISFLPQLLCLKNIYFLLQCAVFTAICTFLRFKCVVKWQRLCVFILSFVEIIKCRLTSIE